MKASRFIRSSAVIAAGVLTHILSVARPAYSLTALIDFGDSQSWRGLTVNSPDANGHYWTSVKAGDYLALTNTDGTVGPWYFGFEGTNPTNGAGDTDSYNGPAGDTSVSGGNVTGCVFAVVALGNLGITNAVYDFYANSRFQIQGLTPGAPYTLTFFGSHKYSDSDYTIYSIFTNATYSALETSIILFVQAPGNPEAHNANTVATVGGVQPASNGILYIQFLGTNAVSGGVGPGNVGGYLNCMQISGSTNTPPPPTDPTRTVLIDFGDSDPFQYRSTNTVSPDSLGHYWNSVDYAYMILTNAAGQATSMAYGLDALGGVDSFNGPAGDTSGMPNPNQGGNLTGCVFNATALGNLGITNAVYDYFVSYGPSNYTGFQIQGMSPAKTYALTFFGSHKYSDSAITTYYVATGSYLNVIAQTDLFVQSPSDPSVHNQDTLATINGISPGADGVLYIKFLGTNDLAGYLNCLQIVDISTNVVVPPPDVNKTILVDFGNNQSYRGTNTPSPDGQGHYWNSLGGTNSSLFTPASIVLTNAAGVGTTVQFAFDAAYTNTTTGFGTDSYNGPAGPTPLNPPSACVFSPSALGYLGITNAVYDYYVNAHFQLQGLETNKTYKLTFFGSHKYNTDNVTTYAVYSDGTYATALASTNLLVGSGASHNQDQVATITTTPRPNGTIYVNFIGSNGNLGYLNCLQIVDVTTDVVPANPFADWQAHYWSGGPGNPNAAPNLDADGDGLSNTNEFLTGFNPTNGAAYPHIISIVKAMPNDLVIMYLGASGDNTWSPGIVSRTNVLEYSPGTPSGSFSNNWVSTSQTNILSGGSGTGQITSFIETNAAASGTSRYYRIRVLVP
jgi:hypothetical protein